VTSEASGRPRSARWPWLVFAVFVGVAGCGLWLVSLNGRSLAEQVPFVIAFGMFGVVGATICARDRGNRVGLIMLFASAITATGFIGEQLTTWFGSVGEDPMIAVVAGILTPLGWLFGALPVLFLLPLVFPDGRPASPRWRLLGWIEVGFLACMAFVLVFGEAEFPGPTGSAGIENPVYLSFLGDLPTLDPLVLASFVAFFALGVVSLVVRFRRSSGIERQQIKWFTFGVLVAFFGTIPADAIGDPAWNAIVSAAAYAAFPISIAVAVLRFRLYDLDLVVRKTVLYAALAVFATLVYLAVVVGIGAWLGQGSAFLTMVAAVVIAVTFQPARTRLTRFADRIVYGRRATPYEVLSAFSERVGGAYADEDVLVRMVHVLGEGVGAERADVWLVVDDELRDVATWPPDAPAAEPIPIADGAPAALPDTDRSFPVEHAGELLGVLAVRKSASDPMSAADEKLVADLAAQARLVLRNVRLTEELRGRLDDLRAAQKRLVAAQDHERRKLERNIHDGAQQQLVALAVKARLARSLTERDPAKAAEMLTQIEGETHEALEDLRDLARGIYPPLLADKGLPAALEAQARKSPIPVAVETDGIDRLPQEVEAAVYFSALEALQNTAKYAEATRATVSLRRSNGAVSFTIVDDGTGFDPAATGYGTGLQGIADRLGALDGELEVTSRPGAGTTVSGRVPVDGGSRGGVET
jgi:signal transduction histidine kinase